MSIPYEIERKFLIAFPDETYLSTRPGCEQWEITQTYLTPKDDWSRRIRRVMDDHGVRYFFNRKQRISNLRRLEEEKELTEAEYIALRAEADPARRVIIKRRWRFPYGLHLMEVDIFPFWDKQAYLEIELNEEEADFLIPPYLKVLREVTDDKRYTNSSLSKNGWEGLEVEE